MVVTAEAVLGALDLQEELTRELAWLDSLSGAAPGPAAPTATTVEEAGTLSTPREEQLANILSNIRRSRDQAALQVSVKVDRILFLLL